MPENRKRVMQGLGLSIVTELAGQGSAERSMQSCQGSLLVDYSIQSAGGSQ